MNVTANGTDGESLAAEATKLLDFNQKLEISLLDKFIGCMYEGSGEKVSVISISQLHVEI